MREEEDRALNARIERLEWEVRELRLRIEALAGSAPTVIPRPPEAVPEPAKAEAAPAPETVSHDAPVITFTAPAPASAPAPSRTREEWETLIGGKLLNRIGALALILGMGFFLKYAFDNHWISETVRALIGGFIGVLLIAGAWRFQRRGLPIFAQGLLGSGISILYLSVYASYNFYHLVSLPAAFVLMSAVTAASLLQALRFNSPAVSLLGWCGGFLTPFLLASGEANEAGLFIYITLLDIGLLGVLFRRPSWAALEPLTLAATYAVFFPWYDSHSAQAAVIPTLFFLTVSWGLFFALDLARILKPTGNHTVLRQWMHPLNAAFFALGLHTVIAPRYPGSLAAVYLALGAAYLLAFLETRRRLAGHGDAPARQALVAAALLVIATGVQFSGLPLVMAWSVEGTALVWCGVYGRVPMVWKTGLALLGLAALRLYVAQFIPWTPSRGVFLWNERALAFLTLAASTGASVFPMRRAALTEAALIREALHYCWAAVLFILCTLETYEQFTGSEAAVFLPFLALCWMAYSLPMTLAGRRTNTAPVTLSGFLSALLALAAGIIAGLLPYAPIQEFRPLLNSRALILLALAVGAVILTLRMNDIRASFPRLRRVYAVLPLALAFLIFSLLTGETMDIFRKSIALLASGPEADFSEAADTLRNLQQMSLSGVWLLYSILLVAYGMWRRLQPVRIIAIALFGFTILKIFIYDLSFLMALYRIVSFLGLGVILLAVSYLYQRYKAVIFESAPPPET